VGGRAVSSFGGDITVSLPYIPESGAPASDYDLLTVYSVDGGGGYSEVKGARYSPATGAMLFATPHLSRFFISEWINPFTDTAKEDWFYRAVRYSYANGLIAGTAENAFSPKSNLTRAMLVTILAREAGIPTGDGKGLSVLASQKDEFFLPAFTSEGEFGKWAAPHGGRLFCPSTCCTTSSWTIRGCPAS
jgi:hypothetical protein